MLRLADAWVWDSWYLEHDGTHHAFYLKASRALGDPNRRHRHPVIGHAVSTDLINWTELADAIAVGQPGDWDSWSTWTGSVIRDESGIWWMFYTGTSREDGGDIQRIGAATSKDLIKWSKIESNPLVAADAKHYETLDYQKWHDEAWRDPWVFRHENQWHMLVTARVASGAEKFNRGVAGHAVSHDLLHWEVEPPITLPAGFGQMEVIQVVEVNGYPTMLWCCGANELSAELRDRHPSGGMFSANGTGLLSGFDISKALWFPHETLYAARLVQHDGNWFLIGFIGGPEDERFGGYLCDPIPVTNRGFGIEPL